MHLWTLNTWKKEFNQPNQNVRTGLRIVYDKDVNLEVKDACKQFADWLRAEYIFPIRIPVYMKASEQIKAHDGEMISASFLGPDNRMQEPYIRVATGDYPKLQMCHGKEKALFMILRSIAHELTHYFQWLNNVELTYMGEERQATCYARHILREYLEYSNRSI